MLDGMKEERYKDFLTVFVPGAPTSPCATPKKRVCDE